MINIDEKILQKLLLQKVQRRFLELQEETTIANLDRGDRQYAITAMYVTAVLEVFRDKGSDAEQDSNNK